MLSKYSYKKLSQNEGEATVPVESEEEERNNLLEPDLSDSGETVMSCDTGTQYSAKDTLISSHNIPDYNFSIHLPLSLREEDCDWGECWIHC